LHAKRQTFLTPQENSRMALTESTTPQDVGKARMVRVWLAITAACLSVFLVLGMTYQSWQPWLDARLGEDSLLVSVAFELVGSLLVAAPLVGLFRAISRMGYDGGTVDTHGRITLQVRDGARRMHVVLCSGLFVLFAAGAIILRDDTLTLRIACVAAAAFSVVGGYIIWTARLVYDDTHLIMHRFALRPKVFLWRNLRDVTWVEEMKHHRLDFTKGRKTNISDTYAGAGDLIALARRMLNQNAGASRS
jgi:hypothetical protein